MKINSQDKEFEQFVISLQGKTRSELNKLSIEIATSIINRNPNTGHLACRRSERLKAVNEELKSRKR